MNRWETLIGLVFFLSVQLLFIFISFRGCIFKAVGRAIMKYDSLSTNFIHFGAHNSVNFVSFRKVIEVQASLLYLRNNELQKTSIYSVCNKEKLFLITLLYAIHTFNYNVEFIKQK